MDRADFVPTAVLGLSQIAPGPLNVRHSSLTTSWQGFVVENHVNHPGERVSASINVHIISMLCSGSATGERRNTPGSDYTPYSKRAGAITIIPAGSVPDMRLNTVSDMLHVAFEQAFTKSVSEEMDINPSPEPIFHGSIYDASVRGIMNLLHLELKAGAPSGSLYADSLAQALASRFVLLDRTLKGPSNTIISALPRRILAKVEEYIDANLHRDLTLAELARVSGYRRIYFLKLFRSATGTTPHQYLLQRRVKRVQQLLRRDAALIDIASACGFSSQSHMTRTFRKTLGTTPAEFRRFR
jgi:AraC family transcriptional regulator